MNAKDEVKAVVTIQRHINLVAAALRGLARILESRADVHDDSKWSAEEFDGYVDIANGRKTELSRAAWSHHQAANSHHPEYHDDPPLSMSWLDIVEMVCDWQAAGVSYGGLSLRAWAIERRKDGRWNLSESQWWLIDQVIDTLEE